MDDKMNDVIDEVQKRLGEEYEVKRVEVMKNNDTKLKGIQVRKKDMNVAKICYWTGESVDEIVDVINSSLLPKFDCKINLEKLKDRIVYTLVNADSNKSRLKTIPYRLLEGTENDLYTFATKNTQKLYALSIMSLTDIVSKIDNQSQEDVSNTPETIFVLTNFKKHFGASCILYPDVLKNFCIEKNMDGVYMIPSSVHEFLLLVMDKEYVNCDYVKQMIKEANRESLEKEDVLSDNLYYYNAVNDAVSIVK